MEVLRRPYKFMITYTPHSWEGAKCALDDAMRSPPSTQTGLGWVG